MGKFSLGKLVMTRALHDKMNSDMILLSVCLKALRDTNIVIGATYARAIKLKMSRL